MGRYPFLTHLKSFTKDTKQFYATVTSREMNRKLRAIHCVLQLLKERGSVGTTNPKALTSKDVLAVVDWMNCRDGVRARPLQPAAQKNILKHLSVFLGFVGNPVLSQMKAKRMLRVPAAPRTPLPSPSEGEVAELLRRLQDEAVSGDLDALMAFGMAALCAGAGLRTKEARLAVRGDLSTRVWQFTVVHPKGEGSWGGQRLALVVPPGRQPMVDYLDLWERALSAAGVKASKETPLVPFIGVAGSAEYWNDAILHQRKLKVEKRLGLQFDFRGLRRAYGQNALDRDARIDSVSVAMGHFTTRTTETYYARRKAEAAFADIERAYRAKVAVQKDG